MEKLSKSAFKLRSGNKPSASKLMGVSPVKHYDESTGEQLKTDTSTNPEQYSGNLATRGKALEDMGMGDIYGQKSFPRNLREHFGLKA